MIKALLRASASVLLFLTCITAYAEDTTFTTSHFSGSGNCSSCHDGMTDTSGEDVSIVRDWGPSMMANSTKDPFWLAKVATEMERNPHLTPVINDVCTRCHAPMANFEINQVQGGELTLFGPDGVLSPEHDEHDAAMNGVSCTVCHQIMDDANLGTLPGFSGNYTINDTKTIYGQYSDILPQPMINNTGYTPDFSAHISDSALCAVCHNLKTPFVDAEGNIASTTPESEFPEQMPYTEWQHSEFEDAGSNPQSCQDCHMPKTTAKVSNRPRWLSAKDGFARHHLVGANPTMLTLLRDNAAQLDVTSPDMDLAIDRARAMLQSAATIEIVSASVTDGVLEARLKVQNNSGHKTPTSYPSRRMWIHFKVTDSSNKVIFESGKINPDGSITGANNDTDQSKYEPHHEVITKPGQVQIYEPVVGDSDGNVTFTLLRAAYYIKDNRLTPKGFDKANVPDDVAVRGRAFNDSDFNLGSDEIIYRFPVAVTGELNVTAALNYQSIEHGFLQDLYRDNQLEQVQTFKAMYDAQDLKHEQIASAQTTVVSDAGTAVAVTGIWPGSPNVGETVDVFIFGKNFTTDGTTTVYFNGVQQASVSPVSSGMLIVRVSPVTAELFGPVTVTTPDSSATSTTSFGTPLTGLNLTGVWAANPVIGEFSSVFLFGSGFTTDGSTEVYFNGVRQNQLFPISSELMIVTVMGDASLSGTVTVVTPAGSVDSADPLIFVP